MHAPGSSMILPAAVVQICVHSRHEQARPQSAPYSSDWSVGGKPGTAATRTVAIVYGAGNARLQVTPLWNVCRLVVVMNNNAVFGGRRRNGRINNGMRFHVASLLIHPASHNSRIDYKMELMELSPSLCAVISRPNARNELRRAAELRHLLERIGQLDQRRFAVSTTHEGNANW